MSGVQIPPPLPFKSFISLLLKDKLTFRRNLNHIRSHILLGIWWGDSGRDETALDGQHSQFAPSFGWNRGASERAPMGFTAWEAVREGRSGRSWG
jgi:hypothetical protein